MLYEDFVRVYLGNFGRYQLLVFLCNSLVSIPYAINNLGIVFQTGVPQHWCSVPELERLTSNVSVIKKISIPIEKYDENGLPIYDGCKMYNQTYNNWTKVEVEHYFTNVYPHNLPNMTVDCDNGWTYSDDVYGETVVSKFDQVCGRDVMIATSMSTNQAGIMVGSLLSGVAADIIGRKTTLIIGLCMELTFYIAVAFSPTMTVFAALRFFTGFTGAVVYTSGYVNVMELVGGPVRLHISLVNGMVWSFSYLLVSLIGYLMPNWKWIQYSAAASVAVIFLTLPFLPESPRWLYTQGKSSRADKIIRSVAKWNKKTLPEQIDIAVEKVQTAYLWDILKTPRLRKRILTNYFCWFVNALVYYGLALNTSNLGGNPYFNFFIAGAVELVGYIFLMISNKFLGRVKVMSFTLLAAGVSLLSTIPIPSNLLWLKISLSMMGKMCIGSSYGMLWLLSAEMFPTVTRQVAISSSYFIASIGGIIAPYINMLGNCSDCHTFIPPVIFGSLAVIAALAGFTFPETKGKNLPETLEEGERFGKSRKEMKNRRVYQNEGISYDGINPAFGISTLSVNNTKL